MFIFVFIFTTVGGESKKILLRFMSKSVLPMKTRGFIVFGLTFRSLIHFDTTLDLSQKAEKRF